MSWSFICGQKIRSKSLLLGQIVIGYWSFSSKICFNFVFVKLFGGDYGLITVIVDGSNSYRCIIVYSNVAPSSVSKITRYILIRIETVIRTTMHQLRVV